MYSSTARGSHVYRPATALPPAFQDETDGEGSTTAIETVGGAAIRNATTSDKVAGNQSIVTGSTPASSSTAAMDVDNGGTNSPGLSVPGSKRPHSLMSTDSDALSSSAAPTPTSNITPITTPQSLSDPPAKKRSKGSKGDSRRSAVSAPAGPVNVAKITPATAVMGMQGSINRLTDIFERSMMGQLGEDPAVVSRNRAIELVQTQDDGLLTEQKVMMISHFMKDIVVAETYI